MVRALALYLVEDLLRGLSGPLGIRLRRAYYWRRLKRCGARLVIEPGVHIVGPEYISLGNDIWLDRNSILIAGPPPAEGQIELRDSANVRATIGEIIIGDSSHIGIGTIIQGHGGVELGECFTSGANAKIYSFSNDHRHCRDGTMRSHDGAKRFLCTPVSVSRNVWLGINTVIVGHSIGANSFVKPGTVVAISIPENSIVAGAPAKVVGKRFVT
jgi:acetyltransferase-like isoleucine patch superfamily enzyme